MNTGVYNNLLTTYSPKPLTKYDTHKASELRNIVNKISKIASTSPVYLVKLTDAKQTYALGVKESSMLLNKNLKELSDTSNEGVFARKKAYSSDLRSVDTEIIGDDYSKLPKEFKLSVNHLATPQVNMGNELAANYSRIDAGTYKFRVRVADDIYDFQYNIKRDASNRDIIEGLSSFINKADIGLTASVEYADDSKHMLCMCVQSVMTGSSMGERIFNLADTGDLKGKNGIIEYLGIDNMLEAPTSSEFYVDGAEKHTLSNEFIISKALKVSLKDTTDYEVDINYLPDSDSIIAGVQKIIDVYNYMVESTDTYANISNQNLKLVAEMSNVIRPYRSELEACGISFDKSGKMQLDKSLAVQSINEGELQKLFAADSPFTKGLLKKTDEIKLNPMDYVDKITVSYPNYKKAPQGFAYITSLYSGMLFNSYC